MLKENKIILNEIYKTLFKVFGPQHWWPGETRIEILVGAILTQNTNWANVEKALENLKKEKVLNPPGLKKISLKKLCSLIRPAGYYNIKAKRLKNFIEFLYAEYDGKTPCMAKEPLEGLRKKLLAVNGIGPETADSILLYACGKPIFVVDTYTKRIFSRHHLISPDADYHAVQDFCSQHLNPDAAMFNEFHALLVKTAKDYCRTKPRCEGCPLEPYL